MDAKNVMRPNSEVLDWDSPSTKTGTVKRRPNSQSDFSEVVNNPVLKSGIPTLKNINKMGNTKTKTISNYNNSNAKNNNKSKLKDSDFQVFDRGKKVKTKTTQPNETVEKSSLKQMNGKMNNSSRILNRRTLDWVKKSSERNFNEKIHKSKEDLMNHNPVMRIQIKKNSNENISTAKICDSYVSSTVDTP